MRRFFLVFFFDFGGFGGKGVCGGFLSEIKLSTEEKKKHTFSPVFLLKKTDPP